jgi:SAM-dependent methyltransferase
MPQSRTQARRNWDASFKEQIALQAYNTAPVEAVIRTLSYYFRERYNPHELARLHFLEIGCGAGPNLLWLAKKGIKVSGVDISPTALGLARRHLEDAACDSRIGRLEEASAGAVPFADEEFHGIIEACVFQHLGHDERRRAFREVRRLLKPGGVFAGYMLDTRHSVYRDRRSEQLDDDPGTLVLSDSTSRVHLTNLGLSHFFTREEIYSHLEGFAHVDACWTAYYLPREEGKRRGYERYLQSMWTVYAVK